MEEYSGVWSNMGSKKDSFGQRSSFKSQVTGNKRNAEIRDYKNLKANHYSQNRTTQKRQSLEPNSGPPNFDSTGSNLTMVKTFAPSAFVRAQAVSTNFTAENTPLNSKKRE